jgi:hypothetical protein
MAIFYAIFSVLAYKNAGIRIRESPRRQRSLPPIAGRIVTPPSWFAASGTAVATLRQGAAEAAPA